MHWRSCRFFTLPIPRQLQPGCSPTTTTFSIHSPHIYHSFINHPHCAPTTHEQIHPTSNTHTYVISIYYYSYSKLYKVYPSCHPYRNTQSMLASLSSSSFAVPVYFAFVSNHVTDRSAILFYPLAASG